jgi:hypothetical protein
LIVDKWNGKLNIEKFNSWFLFYKNWDLIFHKIRSFFHAFILKLLSSVSYFSFPVVLP